MREGVAPGEVDRYHMRRTVTLTANIEGEDLGRVSRRINAALKTVGDPPRGVRVSVRGQVEPMQLMFAGLTQGLVLAVVAILILLLAYFQSLRLAIAVVSTVPAVLAGVVLTLFVTRTTLNIQSFMGAIMSIGVAVANAILLLTFAERLRQAGRRRSRRRWPARRTIEEPGQIDAYEHTPIYSKIPGYVSEVCVDMDARFEARRRVGSAVGAGISTCQPGPASDRAGADRYSRSKHRAARSTPGR